MDSSKDIVSEINADRAHDPRVICEENGILQLNVGGQYFSTTRETLSAAGHSFFSGLISGSFGILRDSKGCVFIDRDPKLFRYVLNFLRSQCTSLAVETDSRAKLRAILIEAEFFQVSPLIEHIQQRLGELAKQEKDSVKAVAREMKQQMEFAAPSLSRGASNLQAPAQGPAQDLGVPAQANGIDDPDSDSDSQDGLDTPTASQGRGYDETEHADMISRAAAAMDMDF